MGPPNFDATFHRTPREAMGAPPESYAYVALEALPSAGRPDGIGVVDLDRDSPAYGTLITRVDMPTAGDGLHHFGWNLCSSALSPSAPHPEANRRYLVVPGLRSSRIMIVDTQPDPLHPRVVRVIEAEEVAAHTGYSQPHTVRSGADAVYVSAIGAAAGDGPGGIFRLDNQSFDVLGAWEKDQGPHLLAHDVWWHPGLDLLVTGEWGTPSTIASGLDPDILRSRGYGNRVHLWDMVQRTHLQALTVDEDDQMVLDLRPAHSPQREYGFAGVTINAVDLSSSIWLWHRYEGKWRIHKVITIEAINADAADLPPVLRSFGAVPPLVTGLSLSLDDRYLYVSCWGIGEVRQYEVSDPFLPRLAATVSLGGIGPTATPHTSGRPFPGGPQMVELSRDGKRLYVTNSLYQGWDEQFYPGGVPGRIARIDAGTGLGGGLTIAPDMLVDLGEDRAHQVRLEGGDSSSDTFCPPIEETT